MSLRDYKFHLFSVKRLFMYGRIIHNELSGEYNLVVSEKNRDLCHASLKETEYYVKKKEGSCHLFRQFVLEYEHNVEVDKSLIILDFEFATNRIYEKLAKISGIIFENWYGKDVKFIDFLKSSSMAARKKQVYFIDKECYKRISRRTTFNIEEYSKTNSIQIPKWYSATGLILSTCTILDDIKFKSDEICVIKDSEKRVLVPTVITSISRESIVSDIEILKEKSKEYARNVKDGTNFQKVSEAQALINNIRNITLSNDFNNITDVELKTVLQNVANCTLENCTELREKCQQAIETLKNKNNVDDKIEWYKVTVREYYISTNLFDGEGLVSNECANDINDNLSTVLLTQKLLLDDDSVDFILNENFKYSGSFQIRLPFIKGVIHTADFKRFFSDHNIKTIKGLSYVDLNNIDYMATHKNATKEIEYDIEKLKIILTESQVKFLKNENLTKMFINEDKSPIECYFDMIYNFNYGLGINNIDPANDQQIRMNYEFWSTLPLPSHNSEKHDKMLETILENTKSDIKRISNPQILVNTLHESLSTSDFYQIDYDYASADQEFYFNSIMGTKYINKNFEAYLNDILLGRIKVDGQRKFLSSDLLYLLYRIIGKEKEMPEEEILHPYQFFAKLGNRYSNFEGKQPPYIFLRTPHYSRNEIGVLYPKINDYARLKYFPKLKSTVMVNPSSLIAERLGGADYDGDAVFILTNNIVNKYISNKIYTKVNTEYYENLGISYIYKYPLIKIPNIKKGGCDFTFKNKIQSWRYGFDSKIGFISNKAFSQALYAYGKYSEVNPNEISFYTLISGIDIDAKKTGCLPAAYTISIPRDKFGKSFIANKKTPKNIVTKFSKGGVADNILIDIIEKFRNEKSPKVEVRGKFISKHLIGNITPSSDKNEITRALKKYCIYSGYYSYVSQKEYSSKILNQISDSLFEKTTKYGVSAADIYDYFSVKDPIKAINLYRNNDYSKPYHFLLTNEEKLEFLKKFDYKNNDVIKQLNVKDYDKIDKRIKAILSFSHEGYKSFYHILQHQRLIENIDVTSVDKIDNAINTVVFTNTLHKGTLANLTRAESNLIIESCKSELLKIINNSKKDNDFDFLEYINNEYGNIDIAAIKSISKDIKNDEIICKLFSKEIIKYLKDGE